MKNIVFVTMLTLLLFTNIVGLPLNVQLVEASPGLAGSPWPMFGQNLQHTHQSPYIGAQTAKVKWTFGVASVNWGAPSPTIGTDGTIYVGSDFGYLYAFNPDGSLKWIYNKAGHVILSSVAIDDSGTIYFGSNDNYIYALNSRDGSLKWRYLTGDIVSSSPAITIDGTILVGSGDGYLYALNPDGTLRWKYKTDYGIFKSSPAVGKEGTIYIGDAGGYLYALDPDGALKWKFDTGHYIFTSPAIGPDGTIYIHSGFLFAINPDGSLKWKIRTGSASSPAIGKDGTIYTGNSAFNPDGSLKWSSNIGVVWLSSVALGIDGTVYVASSVPSWEPTPGLFFNALNPDGTLKWRYQYSTNPSQYINAPEPTIGADGTVYAVLGDGKLYAFGPGPVERLRFKIGDWVQTTAQLNVREGAGLSYGIISTMPAGTLGRIVDGPLYGDGYVWWKVHYFMDYVSVVEGWSAENWLELYTLPICNVKLQKDGIEIDKVNVWEFFDIYVGGSSGDKPIKAVRFSSDDIQDGIPTGEWTDWFSWDASSGDWDAGTKIKRWAFATPGYKEVWAEVRDELGHAAAGSAKIFVPAPALPVLISPLIITPTKNIYNVGDVLEAEFTIKNVGDKPITLDKLLVGGRFNGGKLPNGEFPDFTLQTSITLQPGQSYQYKGSLTLTQTGNYHFFVAYYIENPTAEEKKLLDENNWNTNIELGEGLSHKDRVMDIIVLEEVDLFKLEEAINRWEKVLTTYQYPQNLLDDKSFSGRVSKCWASFTSYITRTQLTEKYKELYSTGVEYHRLSYQALMDAKNCLENGDVEGARKYLQKSYTYSKLSATSFISAAKVYEANLEAGEILAKGIMEGCEAAVSLGVKIVYPPASPIVDGIYTGIDFIITAKLEGIEPATKDLIVRVLTNKLIQNVEFVSLEGDVLVDYVNKVAEEVSLDTLLANKEFMEEFGRALRDAIFIKVVNELGISLTEMQTEEIVKGVVDFLESLIKSIIAKAESPIELRVIDKKGRITGVVNGIVRHEIPMSYYCNGTITIYYPAEPYFYDVAGIEKGHYSLEITLTKERTVTTFQATDIPISEGVLHRYIVNWDVLSLGGEGVTVLVDYNGDGVFEQTFTSDNELNHDEFKLQTATTIDIEPDVLNLKSKGRWITAFIEFPEGYNVSDINISSILLNGTIPVDMNAPIAVGDYDNDGIPDLMVKFNRTAICQLILSKGIKLGNITLTVSGKLIDGVEFEGCDTIRVRMPGDLNMDGKVDMKDVAIATRAFGSHPGHERWNPIADENEDGKIDLFDIALICRNYGKEYK
jgi:outer membrane protein assembly factor BamB